MQTHAHTHTLKQLTPTTRCKPATHVPTLSRSSPRIAHICGRLSLHKSRGVCVCVHLLRWTCSHSLSYQINACSHFNTHTHTHTPVPSLLHVDQAHPVRKERGMCTTQMRCQSMPLCAAHATAHQIATIHCLHSMTSQWFARLTLAHNIIMPCSTLLVSCCIGSLFADSEWGHISVPTHHLRASSAAAH